MTIAFVLSGGGSLGAVQVGMLQALRSRGVRPDVLYGTSVGAINAAFLAGPGSYDERLDRLALLWRTLHRRDVFAVRPMRTGQALLGRRPSVFSDAVLRGLLRDCLGYADFAEASIPLRVTATELSSGRQLLIGSGDVVSAVCASAAVPGLLPPVVREGRVLVDGGIAEHRVLEVAAADPCVTEVYLLPAGYPCEPGALRRSALGIALHALSLLVQHQLTGEVARYGGMARLRVLPPPCPLGVSPADFEHSAELIERARAEADDWLASSLSDSSVIEQVA